MADEKTPKRPAKKPVKKPVKKGPTRNPNPPTHTEVQIVKPKPFTAIHIQQDDAGVHIHLVTEKEEK